jgi:DNA-binding response OmpR family regulator
VGLKGWIVMRPLVVIADADEFLSSAYRAFLVAEGFEVIAVTSGLACIDVLRRQPVTVLILDPDLPWGSGLVVPHIFQVVLADWAG